jgi:uncharacterized protein YceH (UPF0502 family)
MAPFADIAAVEEVLVDLQKYETMLVTLLPRQSGQKEQRYAHLLSGAPVILATEKEPLPEAARIRVTAENDRVAALEEEVTVLKGEMEALKRSMEEFRAQFE